MTDVSAGDYSLVGRLGVTARTVEGRFVLELAPSPAVLHHGLIRTSVLSFLVDAVAGIIVDDEPDLWTFTSDMSVRCRPAPVTGGVEAVGTVLRRGGRSSVCRVELATAPGGAPVGVGAIGFAKVPRRPGDPPKPAVTPGRFASMFGGADVIGRPLRQEAGITVLDAGEGVVELTVTRELRNPAGTLQGAMVALVAEAAAEDLVAARFGVPAVVTEIDLRYLAQARVGPVRTRSRLLGDGPDAPVEIELVDTSSDRLTTLVYARCSPVPGPARR
ncbi:MAG TPA: hypothetical protein VMB72_10405 [Acidimicrobiales bacterium]|nr:hypothetical protein [Acidimicrobiales bacterium]